MHYQVIHIIDNLYVISQYHTATTAAVEGKMSKGLKKLLKKVYASSAHDTLAVADSKLGNIIKANNISCELLCSHDLICPHMIHRRNATSVVYTIIQ